MIFANPYFRRLYTRRNINERVVETPFIFANLPRSGKILDVGACESPVSLMLASMGYKVWENDTRPNDIKHPNLKNKVGSVLDLPERNYFNTVICLSVLEHIGINAYGNPELADLDKLAVAKMYQLLRPGGKLLLTTPIDTYHHGIYRARIYTIAELKDFLHPFSKTEIKIGYKDRKEVWRIGSELPRNFKSFGVKPCAVALISATK